MIIESSHDVGDIVWFGWLDTGTTDKFIKLHGPLPITNLIITCTRTKELPEAAPIIKYGCIPLGSADGYKEEHIFDSEEEALCTLLVKLEEAKKTK